MTSVELNQLSYMKLKRWILAQGDQYFETLLI